MPWDTNWAVSEFVTAAEMNRVGLILIADSGLVAAGGAATVDFSSIPQGYASLQVDYRVKPESAASFFQVRCNNDSGAVYASAGDTVNTGGTRGAVGGGSQTSARMAEVASTDWTAGTFIIPIYSLSSQFHGLTGTFWRQDTYHAHQGAQYEPAVAAAINRLTFLMDSGDVAENSRIILYGKRD